MPVIRPIKMKPYRIKATVRETSEIEGMNETFYYSVKVMAPNYEEAMAEATEQMEDYFDYYDIVHPSQPEDFERSITVSITEFGGIVQITDDGTPLNYTALNKH